MIRWAWRLFRREWRQQLLILLLIVVAVAAVVVGAAVAVNTPPPANAGYGTAHDLATFNLTAHQQVHDGHPRAYVAGPDRPAGASLTARCRSSRTRPSTSPARTRRISSGPRILTAPTAGRCCSCSPGTIRPVPTRSRSPPDWRPSSTLSVGDTWPQGGKTVVGMVQNPQSLLDEFALVPPGQVTHPTQVSVLFDAAPAAAKYLPSYVTPAGSTTSNGINPSTIVLALATVGMLLIALVSIGGFTVLAQRRMRSLGMLESMGATDRNVRLVLEANGVIVGRGGRRLGLRSRPGALVCLPAAQRAERAPRHRHVRPALERDRAGA